MNRREKNLKIAVVYGFRVKTQEEQLEFFKWFYKYYPDYHFMMHECFTDKDTNEFNLILSENKCYMGIIRIIARLLNWNATFFYGDYCQSFNGVCCIVGVTGVPFTHCVSLLSYSQHVTISDNGTAALNFDKSFPDDWTYQFRIKKKVESDINLKMKGTSFEPKYLLVPKHCVCLDCYALDILADNDIDSYEAELDNEAKDIINLVKK